MHAAVVTLIGSIGSWLNINLLIMELRVPPKNIASVQLLSRTIGVGFGIFSPTIASFEAPYPYLILICASIIGFLASIKLPDAGYHLHKTSAPLSSDDPAVEAEHVLKESMILRKPYDESSA